MGQVIDGKYVVEQTIPKSWTLSEVQQVIDDQDARIAKANTEIAEANATKAEHEALKAEMIQAGVTE